MTSIFMVNPRTGQKREISLGFSWTTLLFSCLVPLSRGWWSMFFIMLFSCLITFGLAWLLFPFFLNDLYLQHLINDGFEPATINDMNVIRKAGYNNLADQCNGNENQSKAGYLDDLEKLASLKEKGVLTEDEFLQKKQEILKTIAN